MMPPSAVGYLLTGETGQAQNLTRLCCSPPKYTMDAMLHLLAHGPIRLIAYLLYGQNGNVSESNSCSVHSES